MNENEDVPLPIDEHPELTARIRKLAHENREFNVEVVTFDGKQAIVGIEES